MNSGFYAAFTGLAARTQALEIVANNLANANTTGFKALLEFYKATSAAQSTASLSPVNLAINRFGVLGGSVVDLRAGSLENTGNDTDVAIEGPGFLAVQSRAGIRFTRNGGFHLNAARQLVATNGDLAVGEQGPITLPAGRVSISTDGTISVDGTLAGRLRLVEFAPGTKLVPEGNSNFIAPAGSEHPAAESRVRQGMLESSNLNPVEGSISLIALQRHAEMLQRALSIFHTEFNRTAAEDLPRA